jgi:hypothetical protein
VKNNFQRASPKQDIALMCSVEGNPSNQLGMLRRHCFTEDLQKDLEGW